MIDPGKMTERIRIQKREMVTGPNGWPVEGFVDLATVRAQYRPTGGREFRGAVGPVGEERATFTINYRRDLSQVDRLIHNDRVWDIVHIARVGNKEALDLNSITHDGGLAT